MSLQGIFDPMVKAYFENKYANSGGGGGGATKQYPSAETNRTLFFLYESDNLANLESCEEDFNGDTVYKMCDIPASWSGDLSDMQVTCTVPGSYSDNYTLGDKANYTESGAFYALSIGTSSFACNVYIVQDQDFADAYFFASTGIWVYPMRGDSCMFTIGRYA